MKEFVNSLYPFDYVAKESTQQKKKKKLPKVNELSTSESDSEV